MPNKLDYTSKEDRMARTSRPAIATGIALVSAGLIAVIPTATTPPDIQQRPVDDIFTA